jgi:outer membrane protein TolC
MTMSNGLRTCHVCWSALAVILVALSSTGCTMVGPDYVRPPAPTATDWIETNEPAVKREPTNVSTWWTVFQDPVLNTLVETAYRQNPSLRAAGVRVLEAQAQRGIAIGQLFPQQQDSFGTYSLNELSQNRAGQNFASRQRTFDDWQVGFEATWELDVWGRFRRAIETADATLLASVATYDDVLVSLVAEVATNYLQLRTFQERLAVAHANVVIQERSYYIANAKFQGGTATELDAV